ncbi:methyl-accepting chemotaxis protein [Shewanella eurypsychrophilus]|uniref:Methyl-accepting chemotaxis protein n=1 Tax=Shewanella eurypsychrophilus TaxID=2593656 RepID=A0ABX6VEJ7_9GAMM|nr:MULTISPECIES: methyl-accepting chemotaxis protein [Shewanella]QFU23659.1 methyl-accepting chemotaxis protein [Shewanella sp. YLB-09]QPG58881.1 methyl-accepting chemotaxis protein [Shewanella eurypsychrophilus]
MANNLSFKVKILSTLLLILIATVSTSFFSINYYLSRYILENEQKNIIAQTRLVKTQITDELNSKLQLAETLNLKGASLSEITKTAGFSSIISIVNGLVTSDKGPINDSTQAGKLIEQLTQVTTTSVSDIFYQNKTPLLSLVIPSGNGNGSIFYVELTKIQNSLSQASLDGQYIQLIDSQNQILYSNKTDGELTPYVDKLNIGNKTWILTSYLDNDRIADNTSSLSLDITLALLIVSIITVSVSCFIINGTFKHLSSLRNIIVGLSRGDADLTLRLDVYSQDDLGKIAGGINSFIENLQRMLLDVSQSNRGIQHEIDELTDKTNSNKALLNAHTLETEKVVTAINQMSATAESVAQSGARAAEFTQSTSEEAERSKIVVQQAADSLSELAQQVDDMALSIGNMNQDFEKIDAVLRVIGEIAEQTNLLALNAAIEAARAGEQGRGFAVVADEVRALAARTQQSTSEVDRMLSNLRSATTLVVSSMDSTKKSCSNTVDTTSRVMGSLENMTSSITKINDLTTEIAFSAKEQSVVTEDVNINMIEIHEMISQLSNNAVDTVESTQRLIQANVQLNDVVGGFKLS